MLTPKGGDTAPTVPVKAAGTDINTKTNDTQFLTAKALDDSVYAFNPAIVSGLVAAYLPEIGMSGASQPDQASSVAGHVLAAAATAPVLTKNKRVSVIRWDGSAKPLTTSDSFAFTHIFLVACATDTPVVTGFLGLVSGLTDTPLLVANSTDNAWTSIGGFTYSKNGVVMAENAANSIPLNGVLAVLEVKFASSQTPATGIQLGSDRAFGAARFWKGDIAACLIYNNASMTAAEEKYIRQALGFQCGRISTV